MVTSIMNTLGVKMIISKDKLGTVCRTVLSYCTDSLCTFGYFPV